MNVSGVQGHAYSQVIHQKQSAQSSQQTERAADQVKQEKVQSQHSAVQVDKKQEAKAVADVEKQGKAEKAENQVQNTEKEKQNSEQLLKRMEAQAAMHPAFIQVQQQQAASKTEQSNEATKVSATTNTNTGNR